MAKEADYTDMELTVLQISLELGYSSKKISEILERPREGVRLKLRRLRKKYPEEWDYNFGRDYKEKKKKLYLPKSIDESKMNFDPRLIIPYSPLELELLKTNIKNKVPLLELERILERPHNGILQKLRKLRKEDPEEWNPEVVKSYQREFYKLHTERFRETSRRHEKKLKEMRTKKIS